MTSHPVILFDGVCNLCNRFVRFIIRVDRKHKFRFASLQSAYAVQLLAKRASATGLSTMVLYEDGRFYDRSGAVLHIARLLGFPWSLAFALMIIPRAMRDAVYNWVAANRYKWFGQRESCMVPTPELKAKFLE